MPINNHLLCDSLVDLGPEDNMLNMLGRNVANFLSLGYFSGYDASLDPYCIYLEDKPKKIMCNTFSIFSFDFFTTSALLKIKLIFFAMITLMFSL